jgi:hypothetical protein
VEKERLMGEVAEMNKQYAELTIVSEKRAEENFTLK